ncbi:hypothetical protein ACQHIV_18880 [Kribbella sp. GL6]|uniref:hypothetical protein n=1 Tax=Kribbella sp. GL6 TaxID=3419765 RepID=UPI003D090B95
MPGFLRSWRVDIGAAGDAAVAVLPPADGRRRGYGAWWVRGGNDEAADQLVRLARATPGVEVLQIGLPAGESVRDARFKRAYPVWTMSHDGISWPDHEPELVAPLEYCGPDDMPHDGVSWRGHGVCTALLGTVLHRSRGLHLHLTVDGESPTRAHELYLRHGFRIAECLVRYEVQVS